MGAPRFVTLTGGRGHITYTRRPGFSEAYGMTGGVDKNICDRDVDAAIIRAYTENVGHPPRNLAPMDDGYEQWHYNPRRPMYRGRADELARVPPSFGDCDECGTFGVDRDYTGSDGRSVCDECREAAA